MAWRVAYPFSSLAVDGTDDPRVARAGTSRHGRGNDEEMLNDLPETAAAVLSDIETLDLKTSFPVVLLANNLIDNPDRGVRSKLLATCRRHVSEEGVVVLQRYQPDLEGWEPGNWVERGAVAVLIPASSAKGITSLPRSSIDVGIRRGLKTSAL